MMRLFALEFRRNPIKKSTIFLVKLITAAAVSIVAMLLCNTFVFVFFYNVETVFSMVTGDTISIGVFYDTAKLSILFSVIGAEIGLISMRAGFIKKSTHITLITAFSCSVLLSNLLSVSLLADFNAAIAGFTIFAAALSVVAAALSIGLAHKVNLMEGE